MSQTDILISLPDDLRQKILERLPLQDTVRTNILSKHWRYEWTKLPHIIFDQKFFLTVVRRRVEASEIWNMYSNIVNNVLVCHVGPLRKFVLYIPNCVADGSTICIWLRFVSQKSVGELTMTDHRVGDNREKLPSSLFLNTGLTRLTLRWCKVDALPPTFTGFPYLISLELFNCFLKSANLIEHFISSCPQLRFLRLDTLVDDNDLTIRAPKLEHLYVVGLYRRLCLGNETAKIKTLELDFVSQTHSSFVFNSRLALQRLRLETYFLKSINHESFDEHGLVNDPGQLETRNLELIDVPPYCPYIHYFSLKLLNNSRTLQRLYYEVSEYQICGCGTPSKLSLSDLPTIENLNFQSLKYVELVCVTNLGAELQFIKAILECSPILEVMTIKVSDLVNGVDDKSKIAMEVMEYPRASRSAQIIFKG